VATRTGPMDWQAALDADPRLIATALQVLEERNTAMEKAAKRRR
jgi:hypothetical protein